MDSPRKRSRRHNSCNRYGDVPTYRRVHFPQDCGTDFWQPGGVPKHQTRQCTLWDQHREKFPQKKPDVGLVTLKNNTLKRLPPEKAYDYKRKNEEPERTTWATGGANDLRSLIEYKRACRCSMARAPLSGKQFNCNYDGYIKEHRIVYGSKVTLMLNRKGDCENNDPLTGPVAAQHTKIKKGAETRAEDNSPIKKSSIHNFLKKRLRVPESLPQNVACKNTENKDHFRRSSDDNKFRVPEPNPDEKERLQKTEEMTPESKFPQRKRLLRRKSTDPPGGPAPKRRRWMESTFNSVEVSEVIVHESYTHNDNNNDEDYDVPVCSVDDILREIDDVLMD